MQPAASADVTACQSTQDALVTCSDRRLVPSRVSTSWWCVTHLGVVATLHLVGSKLGRIARRSDRPVAARLNKPAGGTDEELNLQPGEIVEVKSEREIQATLDERGRHRGLLWMPGMAKFCGKRYAVHKRVERIMLESTGQLRKIRNTVLLENVMCEDLYGCDRSCFHYWREAWLRRVS
jgi:hypothetical protein